MLGRQFPPEFEQMLRGIADDLPPSPPSRLSTGKGPGQPTPWKRLNKEIKRRAVVVGVFPNPDALLRQAGAVLVEAHDEWPVNDRRYLSEASMALLNTTLTEVATTPLAAS